ncbi:MAG: hypothetical protein ABI439_04070 [Rhodospirillales bacterium]
MNLAEMPSGIFSVTGSALGIFVARRSSATSNQRAININGQVAAKLLSPSLFRSRGYNAGMLLHPLLVRAGQSMVEPPNAKMTGYSRSATERLKVLIFYVADPGTPFLDVH